MKSFIKVWGIPSKLRILYFEFNKDDVSYVEELPNLVDLDGNAIAVVRIWVKKLSVAIRCTPFIVEDTGKIV